MSSIIEIEDEETLKCGVCKEISIQKCSGCKQVAYCGKDHQKQHWKIHKPKCKKLCYEIKSNNVLGRFITASSDIKYGNRIINDPPLIVGPRITLAEPVCLGCHKPVNPKECGMNRCLKCLWPACSSRCSGLTDAHTHAAECFILRLGSESLLAFNDYKYEAILPLRCLILQRRSPKKYEELKQMEAHINKRGPGTEVYIEINSIVNYLRSNFLKKLPEDVLDDTSEKCLHWICGIIDVNAMDINRYTQGLYATMCLLEHSCLPNSKHMFLPDSNNAILKAAVDISKGFHVSTMYTNALWGTQARREHLSITKYFSCSCDRCADPTELGTYFSALKCLNEENGKCPGYILPANPIDPEDDWKCDSCPAILNPNDVRFVTNQLGEQVDKLVQENPNIDALEKMLTKLLAMFHPNHYHCYAVKHSLIQLYGTQRNHTYKEIDNSKLETKIALCRELIRITNKLDPGHCRLTMYLGVLLYELHSALLESVRRQKDTKTPKEKIISLIQEAKSLLETNLNILESEPEFSTGFDMSILTKISLADVKTLLKKYKP